MRLFFGDIGTSNAPLSRRTSVRIATSSPMPTASDVRFSLGAYRSSTIRPSDSDAVAVGMASLLRRSESLGIPERYRRLQARLRHVSVSAQDISTHSRVHA